MASFHTFARISDGALMRFFAAAIRDGTDLEATFHTAAQADFTLGKDERLNDEWRSVFDDTSYLITSVTFKDPAIGCNLRYRRGLRPVLDGSTERWQPASPFIDGLAIDGPTRGPDQFRVLRALRAHIDLAPPLELSEAGDDALDRSREILNRVSTAVATLVEHSSERQKSLDAARDSLALEADERFRQRLSKLDIRQSRDEKKLADRERELETKLSALDDRANTHVRRELQKSMAKLSEDVLEKPLLGASHRSFVLTEIVAVGFAVLLIALAALQSALLTTNNTAGNLLIFGEVRTVLLGIGAGALIWYALRQSAARNRQVSRWENDLNRFRLDTERASFLIEGDLEARKLSQSGLPEVMLDRFSRGLFGHGHEDRGGDGTEVGTTLAYLLNRAAKLKIGPNGVEAEVDKAGIKRAGKDAGADGGDEA